MKTTKVFFIISVFTILAAFSGCSSSGSSPSVAQTSSFESSEAESKTTESNASNSESSIATATVNSDLDNQNNEEAEKNIEVKAIPTENKQLCVFITNKNSFIVDELDIEATFYDKDGNPVDFDSDGHDMILPGATVVSSLDLPSNYEKYETNVTVELGVNQNYQNHSDKVQLTQNATKDGVIVQVKNTDTKPIDEIEIKAVFYNGNNVVEVSYDEDIHDLGSGKTKTVEIMCLDKFDKVEIYLNQAHTFGL